MKIATWNINSVRARLDNVLGWLNTNQPDILCLQEIKCETEQFPLLEIQAAGYTAHIVGQKSYNGVAVLSRQPVTVLNTQLPNAPDDQARFISIETPEGLRVVNIYVPNGNPMGTDKYAYKQAWLSALRAEILRLNETKKPLVVCGDFNIIPEDLDCYDPKSWAGDALFQPDMRAWYRGMQYAGFMDAYRSLNPTTRAYSFWDYQGGAWSQDFGIRIDHFLLNPEATNKLQNCTIDKQARAADKASDHVPVVLSLNH